MAARPHARRADARLMGEAEDAHRALRRYQARRVQPPVELWRLRDAAGFLIGLLVVVLGVVLLYATGSQA